MLGKLKKRKRLRTHGFRARMAVGGGVVHKRRTKGRKQLTVSVHSK